MSFLEVIAAIEHGVAAMAPRGSYHHGVVGRTGSWRRPDRYRFAEVRHDDAQRAFLLIHPNASEVEETPFDASQPQAPDEIARRIVAHLEI
jgi:hypothetical protein